MAHPDKEHRDRYMRSSACLRFGCSGESEEGNSELIIQNSKLPVTFTRLRSFCAILRILT